MAQLTEKDFEFLEFDDAVVLSNLLTNFVNSTDGRRVMQFLADRFELKLKPNYQIQLGEIRKDCPDCMGCHQGVCILGCLKLPQNEMCFWEKALKRIIGTRLVVHENAHLWFIQGFEIQFMDKNQFYEEGEKFAQYVENNFTKSLVFCEKCQSFVINLPTLKHIGMGEAGEEVVHAILFGAGIGIGFVFVTSVFAFLGAQRRKALASQI